MPLPNVFVNGLYSPLVYSVFGQNEQGQNPPPPPGSQVRITDIGDDRITDDGDRRITD